MTLFNTPVSKKLCMNEANPESKIYLYRTPEKVIDISIIIARAIFASLLNKSPAQLVISDCTQ